MGVGKCFFVGTSTVKTDQMWFEEHNAAQRNDTVNLTDKTNSLQRQQQQKAVVSTGIWRERGNSKWGTDLVLGQGWLGLAIRSLALTVIPSHRRATGRGRHTRHGADLCNLVCLCRWHTRRNQFLLRSNGEPAHFWKWKHHLGDWICCRDHCITWKIKRLTSESLKHTFW